MRPHILESDGSRLIVNPLAGTGKISVTVGNQIILLTPLEASEAVVAIISCIKALR